MIISYIEVYEEGTHFDMSHYVYVFQLTIQVHTKMKKAFLRHIMHTNV